MKTQDRKLKWFFWKKKNSTLIKLIEPVKGNTNIENFVNRGGGFHHICFRCEEMNKGINNLKSKGLFMLVPPQPGEAFDNNDIAFLMGKNGVNIELIDTGKKASII